MLDAYVAKPWPVADNQVHDFPNFLGFVSKVYPSSPFSDLSHVSVADTISVYSVLTTPFHAAGCYRRGGLVLMGTSVFHRSSTFSPTVIKQPTHTAGQPAGRTATAHAWVDCSQAKNNADFNDSLLYSCCVALRQTQLPNYREPNHNYCIML